MVVANLSPSILAKLAHQGDNPLTLRQRATLTPPTQLTKLLNLELQEANDRLRFGVPDDLTQWRP